MLTHNIPASSNRLIVKSIILICILLIMLNAVILYTNGYEYYKFGERFITVEMKTPIAGFGKVYFDMGFDYQEYECSTFEIRSTSDFEKYRMLFPERPIKSIRFDPFDKEGPFEIKSITVETRDDKWSWENEELARRIVLLHQIKTVSISPNFRGFAIGIDPNFHVEGLTVPDNSLIRSGLSLSIVISSISIALMGFVVIFLINALTRSGLMGRIKINIVTYLDKSMRCHITPTIVTLSESYRSIQGWIRCGNLRWVGYAGLAVLVILFGRTVWNIYIGTGFFRWIGTDFALYYAQSIALWSGDPSAVYKPEVYDLTFQKLLNLYSPPNLPAAGATYIPYPPLFAWLFTPFTTSSPLIGFALWEMISLLAVIHLAWRVTQLFPDMKLSWVMFVLLASFPVVYCMMLGQPQLLYACAVAECYLSLRKDRDFQAGLWLAVLFFKPQYGILLGMLLIWKRRWAAVSGAFIGALVVVGGSVLVAGVGTLMAYPTTLTDMKEFLTDDVLYMINWRALVLALLPQIGELKAKILSYDLALLTIFFTALVWRGAWLPQDSRFSARFTLVLLATLLANHHSFNYGAVVLIVPLAATLAEGKHDRLIQLSVIAGIVLPTLTFTLVSWKNMHDFNNLRLASLALTFSLLALYASLLLRLWRYHESAVDDQSPLILSDGQLGDKAKVQGLAI